MCASSFTAFTKSYVNKLDPSPRISFVSSPPCSQLRYVHILITPYMRRVKGLTKAQRMSSNECPSITKSTTSRSRATRENKNKSVRSSHRQTGSASRLHEQTFQTFSATQLAAASPDPYRSQRHMIDSLKTSGYRRKEGPLFTHRTPSTSVATSAFSALTLKHLVQSTRGHDAYMPGAWTVLGLS